MGELANLVPDDRMDIIINLLKIEFDERRDNVKGPGDGSGDPRES